MCLYAQEVREKHGSFMAYVISLPKVTDETPEHMINQMNCALGIADPALDGGSIMASRVMELSEVGKTCVYHWSFAPNSLWSGEAGLAKNWFGCGVGLGVTSPESVWASLLAADFSCPVLQGK